MINKNRLRWQARRGLLELDLLLQRFLAEHLDYLDNDTLLTLEDVLLLPDAMLLELCQAKVQTENTRWQKIVQLIQATAVVNHGGN